MLLTAGERISMALLAMAIHNLGYEARSFTGSQAGVITDLGARQGADHRRHAGPDLRTALDEGAIAIVAGFQGVSRTPRTSPRWAAAARTPPRSRWPPRCTPTSARSTPTSTASSPPTRGSCPNARHIKQITYEEMLELAACGAKVLHLRCVEYARRYNVPIHVRSSFSNKKAPLVTGSMEDLPVEQASSPASPTTAARPRSPSSACPTSPARPARIFETVAQAEINIDMIVQNVSAEATGRTDISFTLPKADGPTAMAALDKIKDEIGFESLLYDDQIGKVSLIGAGMRSHPGVAAKFFAALAEAGVNIEMISTSEIRISVVCRDTDLDTAVRACTTRSTWAATTPEAVVYAGTGRYPCERCGEQTEDRAQPTLAVVGATGAVGTVMLDLLSSRRTSGARSG
jgi:aspartate kinase